MSWLFALEREPRAPEKLHSVLTTENTPQVWKNGVPIGVQVLEGKGLEDLMLS